jgi:hypothetical protein
MAVVIALAKPSLKFGYFLFSIDINVSLETLANIHFFIKKTFQQDFYETSRDDLFQKIRQTKFLLRGHIVL